MLKRAFVGAGGAFRRQPVVAGVVCWDLRIVSGNSPLLSCFAQVYAGDAINLVDRYCCRLHGCGGACQP